MAPQEPFSDVQGEGGTGRRAATTWNADVATVRRIVELHFDPRLPAAARLATRSIVSGFDVGRKQVTTLMRSMGIEALYRKPRTSDRKREHTVFPYLLRGLTIDRPIQVWAMDRT